MRSGPLVAGVVLVWTLAVDLGSKTWAVANEDAIVVVYNGKDGQLGTRVVMSAVALAATAALSRAARWRGYPEIWGLWIGSGLLVGGVLANGASRLLWERGVPDFIFRGQHIWNLADFAIGLGLTGGILSLFGTALVAYARGRIHVARP